MNELVLSQVTKLGKTLDIEGNSHELLTVLKNTAFKGSVTDAQMAALLVIASQYSLNPWAKEIYAFPDSNNGIVPVVGVDGWSRIINSHPQFDGMDFEQDSENCTCIIYRKDRKHPVKVTEWMDECNRGTKPWNTHPKRMLRHKALIQCARLAFGFTGIYDQDEAERIVEKDMGSVQTEQQFEAPKRKSEQNPTQKNQEEKPHEAQFVEKPQPGQLKWIEQKCKSLDLDVIQVIGANGFESLDELTVDGFDLVKKDLMSR